MSSPVTFNRKEITFIFLMLVVVSSIIFGVGIYVGREYQKMTAEDEIQAQKTFLSAKMLALAESLKEAKQKIQENSKKEIEEKKTPKPLNGYTIQVGMFDEKETAQDLLQKFQSHGFPSVFIKEATVEQRLLFFLDLGFFEEQSTAQNFARKLQKRGLISKYFIRKTHFDNVDDHSKN